jgi:hypothetical protein
MCAFSKPKMPDPAKPPPPLAERQPIRLPDGGSTDKRGDDIAKRRRALAAMAYSGALGLLTPKTTSTNLGG